VLKTPTPVQVKNLCFFQRPKNTNKFSDLFLLEEIQIY